MFVGVYPRLCKEPNPTMKTPMGYVDGMDYVAGFLGSLKHAVPMSRVFIIEQSGRAALWLKECIHFFGLFFSWLDGFWELSLRARHSDTEGKRRENSNLVKCTQQEKKKQ